MGDGFWGALVGGLAVLIPAAVSAIVLLRRSRTEVTSADASTEAKRDRSALGPLRETVNDLRAEIKEIRADVIRREETWKAHTKEQQEVLERCVRGHRREREQRIREHGYHVLMYDFAVRTAAAVKRLGQDPGNIPVMLPEPTTEGIEEVENVEFQKNQLAQATKLLSAIPPPT